MSGLFTPIGQHARLGSKAEYYQSDSLFYKSNAHGATKRRRFSGCFESDFCTLHLRHSCFNFSGKNV